MNKFTKTCLDIVDTLSNIKYDNGDASDIGNEIGIVIAKHLSDEMGWDCDSFISGIKHGMSLTDGTHFSEYGVEERLLTFEERCDIYLNQLSNSDSEKDMFIKHSTYEVKLIKLNNTKTPTRLITKIINGKVIKNYE